MKRTLPLAATAALLLGAITLPAHAADPVSAPRLVKDIFSGTATSMAAWTSSDGPKAATLGGTTLFAASSGGTGNELWASDGTDAGTRLVRDIWPGPTSSAPERFTTYAGKVYFSAEGSDNKGVEVWSSDGTAAGTVRVTDLNAGAADSDPKDFVVAGGVLYFTVKTFENNRTLYRYDTTDGTSVLTSANIQVSNVAAWGDKIIFAGDTATEGNEPWTSDGTFTGTKKLGNVHPGVADSSPRSFTPLGNGDVLFSAIDATHGRELWTSNGTVTQQLKDFFLGAGDGSPTDLFALDGLVYFGASTSSVDYSVWVTNGTGAGTQKLASSLRTGSNGVHVANFTPFNGQLYFAATEAVHGPELWRTDGTPAGTQMVRDIKPGSVGSSPSDLTVIGGLLYLFADDQQGTKRLWRSDGTTAATSPVTSAGDPTDGQALSVTGTTLLFAGRSDTAGRELWAYTPAAPIAAPATAPAGVVKRATSVKAQVKHRYSRNTATKKKIKVTIRVRATGISPTGKVVLKKGSAIIGQGSLKKGKVTIRLSKKLQRGTTKIRAYYAGNATAAPSRSGVIMIKVR